jgi:hypothetical protein
MLTLVFPVVFLLGLIGLAGLCVKARAALTRAGDPPTGRSALLLALTRNPGAILIKDVNERRSGSKLTP